MTADPALARQLRMKAQWAPSEWHRSVYLLAAHQVECPRCTGGLVGRLRCPIRRSLGKDVLANA